MSLTLMEPPAVAPDLQLLPAAAAESLAASLAPYREPHLRQSLWQLVSTLALVATAWVLMYASLRVSYFLTLALAVPTAILLVRLFIFQHDCGHGAFFRSSRAASLVGAGLGVLTLTPYAYWKRTHAIHHATSGNLDHRGFGDITTLTVAEYLDRDWWGRFKYRVYRHPLSLFFIGPMLHFFIIHRLPTIVPPDWRRERRSILWTNVGVAGFVGAMIALMGWKPFLLIYLPLMWLSAIIGVWLFYVQHQFEPTYWEHDPAWKYESAALDGSSYYVLPRLFQWLTGNIGLHHIHHLNPRIPNYNLEQAMRERPELSERVTRLTFGRSLSCVSLTLWDEASRKLVPFSHLSTPGARTR
jgi:omega-6 fatty acid desaturase (delta-12 desaturase)